MAHSLTRRTTQLVLTLAGLVFVGAASTALAQSRVADSRAASPSAVARGTAKGTSAIQNGEKSRAAAARETGRTAMTRSRRALTANGATVAAAPAALALEDNGAPASTPEPLSVLLVGGALAGLYRLRRHIS